MVLRKIKEFYYISGRCIVKRKVVREESRKLERDYEMS